MMEKAVVIGYGIVGRATAMSLGIKNHFDIDENKSNITLKEVSRLRYVFICLPTPVHDGEYVVSDIYEIIRQILEYGSGAIFIIRSTVYPGFADHIYRELQPESVISNPEFLSEDTWQKDSKYAPFILIGGREGRFRQEVADIYKTYIKTAKIILTDNITAETAKLAMNAYFSTKVTFANQIYDYCQQSGANYERIKEVMESHPFGPKNHFEIFYKGKRGIHGKCLPKDLDAFVNISKLPLLEKVKEINDSAP